jgi:hypothetical protein
MKEVKLEMIFERSFFIVNRERVSENENEQRCTNN